jgi:hypothetical protein
MTDLRHACVLPALLLPLRTGSTTVSFELADSGAWNCETADDGDEIDDLREYLEVVDQAVARLRACGMLDPAAGGDLRPALTPAQEARTALGALLSDYRGVRDAPGRSNADRCGTAAAMLAATLEADLERTALDPLLGTLVH